MSRYKVYEMISHLSNIFIFVYLVVKVEEEKHKVRN